MEALSIAALFGPLVLLVVAGVMLVRVGPTLASGAALVGFAVHLVASIAANVIGMRMVRTMPDDLGGSMVVLQRFDGATTAATIGQVGLWMGALGLIWALSKLSRPNESLERTRDG